MTTVHGLPFPISCPLSDWAMHKYIIMGVQGCGKGTQARLLSAALDLTHISVGDIFRWNIQAHTKLAARIKRIMDEGRLVPDEIVDEIVQRRLDEHDWNYGFILDGFPRNRRQAEFFLESYDIDAVILLNLDDSVVIERIQARRLCEACGLDHNLMFHRPVREGICDVCGGSLLKRPDDNEEAVRARLADYHEKTRPIVDLFKAKELVVVVDGNGSPDQIHKQILSGLAQDAGGIPRLDELR
jgi:adenylate kinase